MASSSNSPWTRTEDKIFEDALALYGRHTADRWQKIARAVGGKTAQEVKRHYEILERDVRHIEAGQIPIPKYKASGSNGRVDDY